MTTDATGTYRIAGLQPGPNLVGALLWTFDVDRLLESSTRNIPAEADASGQRIAALPTYYPGVNSVRAAQVVTIEAGDTPNINFVIRRGPVSTLAVQLGQPDPSVRGLTMAYLMPTSVPDQFGQRQGVRAVLDAAGTATFADVTPGPYHFTYMGLSGWVRETVTVPSQPLSVSFTPKPFLTVSGRVDLRPTRVAGGPDVLTTLTVSLNPSPLTTGSPLLRAPVSADGTFCLTSGTVVVFSCDNRFWIPGASRRVRVATIVPAGGFSVNGLPQGTYHAAAFPAGARIVNSALEEAKGRSIPFELAIGEKKEIVVR